MDQDDDQVVSSVMVPDLSIFEGDIEDDKSDEDRALSPWALAKIGTFQYRLEELIRYRELKRGKITLISHIPTSIILRLANDVFGFNGWSSTILEWAAVSHDFDEENNEYSMTQEAIIQITLQDGTTSRAAGVGSCQKLPHKYMCLGYSKKIAITVGLRNAILNLTGMSMNEENIVKSEISGATY